MTPRRFNRYVCECGLSLLSEDIDIGVTPFMVPCKCGKSMYSQFYKVKEDKDSIEDITWRKPTPWEEGKLTSGMLDHVKQGGLIIGSVSEKGKHLQDGIRRQYK